jgi:hypothetical protein
MTTEIFQSQCQIFKRISGKWLGGCGFLDGEKLICMDGLYEDVITNNCLVYSFGVGKYNLEGAIKERWGFDPSVPYRICVHTCLEEIFGSTSKPPICYINPWTKCSDLM